MDISFLSDDRRVISVEAGGRAVLQWRTLGVNQYDTEYDWAVMECVDEAIAKLANRHSTKAGGPTELPGRDPFPRSLSSRGPFHAPPPRLLEEAPLSRPPCNCPAPPPPFLSLRSALPQI